MKESRRPKVFISHASVDAWVARQIEASVKECGAESFLDCVHIEYGDDFDDDIIDAAEDATEILVLFTPTSKDRKYIWLEIGMFLALRKRVVAILYNVTTAELATDQFTPVALKRLNAVDINKLDEYFDQLRKRVEVWETTNV